MGDEYLRETELLDYGSPSLQSLISQKGWRDLSEYDAIGDAYHFVRDEILFGYNRCDTLKASEVLRDGIGQCNTKAILLMAFLRGFGIACRLHGFTASKDFQRGAVSGIIALMAPDEIVHTWIEVLFEKKWIVLEGVIIDKRFLDSVKRKYLDVNGPFRRYAIAVDDFPNFAVDWNGLWLVILGIILSCSAVSYLLILLKQSFVLALLTFSSLFFFSLGAGVLAGIFKLAGPDDKLMSVSSKIHGYASALGFSALLFFPLLRAIAVQDAERILSDSVSFASAFLFFVLFIISDKERFKNCLGRKEGTWERLSLFFMYFPCCLMLFTFLSDENVHFLDAGPEGFSCVSGWY